PTASVFIATKNGAQLTADQVQAIVHLTSAAVEGMQPTDVSVVDSKGQTLSAVGTGAAGSGTDQAADYDQATSKKIQDLLDTTLGAGNATVVVSATMNQNTGTKTSESYASPTGGPVALNESSTTEQYGAGSGAGGAGATGVLGPDNIAVPNGSATSGAGNDYKNESATKNNAVDHTTETTQIPAGALENQSVSVALNAKAASVQNANLQSINDLVSRAAGIDTTRGDKIAVAMMNFDTTAAAQAAAALKAQQQADQQASLWATIRTAGIVIGSLLALIAIMWVIARRARRQEREAVDLGELDAFSGETFQLPLAVDEPEALRAGDTPTVALPTLPVEDAPTEVLTTEEISAERRRQDIQALAERDPKRTADLLRGLLDDRAPV
ncbi:flagellar M-ring protein FliF C-terminal domain-containing protein, partial [Curtobacterium sp. B8]